MAGMGLVPSLYQSTLAMEMGHLSTEAAHCLEDDKVSENQKWSKETEKLHWKQGTYQGDIPFIFNHLKVSH